MRDGAPLPLTYPALILVNRLKIEGFIVSDHWDLMGEYVKDVSGWIKEGKIQVRETVENGIENAVTAFLKLFSGGNLGKMLVKL